MLNPIARLKGLKSHALRSLSGYKIAAFKPTPDIEPIITSIKAALSHSSGRSFSLQTSIEQLRTELERSNEAILQKDYGAGRDENLPSGAGRTVTRTVGEVTRSSSRPQFWCQVLHNVAREKSVKQALEMGTCMGISAAYIGAALQETGGQLCTLEGATSFAEKAKNNLQRLGLENVYVKVGAFAEILEPTLREMSQVDFVFVDGHHDEQATVNYFKTIIPYTTEGAVVIFDDIRWSEGMQKAWKSICAHERTRSTVDLGSMGVITLGLGPSSHLTARL